MHPRLDTKYYSLEQYVLLNIRTNWAKIMANIFNMGKRYSILYMEKIETKEKIKKILIIGIVIMSVILLLDVGLCYFFHEEYLIMDTKSYRELMTVVNAISDSVMESESFILTEYKDTNGVTHTETLVLGEFQAESIEDDTGVSSEGLSFSGYVYFLGREEALKNKLFVRHFENERIANCFDGMQTDQSAIVNALIEDIGEKGVMLSDSMDDMYIRLDENCISGDIYGNDMNVILDVSINSKWALFGKKRTETETTKIMNRVQSVRIPYIDGYFLFPTVGIGEINPKDNVVTWSEYYSQYDSLN